MFLTLLRNPVSQTHSFFPPHTHTYTHTHHNTQHNNCYTTYMHTHNTMHTHTHTHTTHTHSHHPQVVTNMKTELHFEEIQFFSDDSLYQRGIDWSAPLCPYLSLSLSAACICTPTLYTVVSHMYNTKPIIIYHQTKAI